MNMHNMTVQELAVVRYDVISRLLTGIATVTYVDFDGVIQTRRFSLTYEMQAMGRAAYVVWEASLTREQRAARRESKKDNVAWDDMSLVDQLRSALFVDVDEKRVVRVNIPYILSVE